MAVIKQEDSSSDEVDEDGYISSGTSSYDSTSKDFNKREEHKQSLMDMLDEFEDPSGSSYARTQNEIDPDQMNKYAPKIPELDELDQVVEFGTVFNFIDDGLHQSVVMVKPSNPQQIYDLDNIVALKSKEVIGFVLDLVGHVTTP